MYEFKPLLLKRQTVTPRRRLPLPAPVLPVPARAVPTYAAGVLAGVLLATAVIGAVGMVVL